MTSRIDRAFIRAFAKQRGDATTSDRQEPQEAPPQKQAPAEQKITRVTRRVDDSEDALRPAGMVWQAPLQASVSTAAMSNVETRGLENIASLEVTSMGTVFPTDLFDAGDLEEETSADDLDTVRAEQNAAATEAPKANDSAPAPPNATASNAAAFNAAASDTVEKALGSSAVVPSLSPESVRRRLDEAPSVATPHLKLPEQARETIDATEGGEGDMLVVEEVRPTIAMDRTMLELEIFAPMSEAAEATAGDEQGTEGERKTEGRQQTEGEPDQSLVNRAAAPADVLSEPEPATEPSDAQVDEDHDVAPLLHIKGPFVPAWEADEIQWPRMAERLQTLDDRFEAAGSQLAQAAREGLRTLAVTSTYRGEGRTTIAMNLARSASAAGIRVALVDGDVDNPALASSAGIAAAHGWHECLAGGLPLDEAAVASIGDGVTLLPLTSAVRRASVAASGAAFASMLEALSLHFDLIVVDYGPLGEHPAPIVGDAAMLVRDIRCTSAEQALTAVRKIRELGPRSVGVVQNFT